MTPLTGKAAVFTGDRLTNQRRREMYSYSLMQTKHLSSKIIQFCTICKLRNMDLVRRWNFSGELYKAVVIHGVWIVGSLFHMGFNSGLNEMKLARNYLWAIRSVNVVICSGKLFCGFLFLVHIVGVLDNGGLMRWLDYDAINNYWTRLNVPVQREKVYKRRINCDLPILICRMKYWYQERQLQTKKCQTEQER